MQIELYVRSNPGYFASQGKRASFASNTLPGSPARIGPMSVLATNLATSLHTWVRHLVDSQNHASFAGCTLLVRACDNDALKPLPAAGKQQGRRQVTNPRRWNRRRRSYSRRHRRWIHRSRGWAGVLDETNKMIVLARLWLYVFKEVPDIFHFYGYNLWEPNISMRHCLFMSKGGS